MAKLKLHHRPRELAQKGAGKERRGEGWAQLAVEKQGAHGGSCTRRGLDLSDSR
jgi:hypothetical protein